MEKILAWAAIAFAVLVLLAVRLVPSGARIVDGDTMEVRGRKWRLVGYDSPERDQPGGKEASARLQSIVQGGLMIGIICGIDRYHRLLVRCYTLRGPLSWRMMGSGHGHATTRSGHIPTLYARARGVGIWDGRHEVVAPVFWRATHPRPMPSAFRPVRAQKVFRNHRKLVRRSKKWLH